MRHLYVTGEGVILGVAENQSGSRVHVAWDQDTAMRWRAELRRGAVEGLDGIAISDLGLDILIGAARPGNNGEIEAVFAEGADEDEDKPLHYRLGPKGQHFIACSHPVTGFKEFLKVWSFIGLTGKSVHLGEHLWKGQEEFCKAAAEHNRVYYLKARRLGFSTNAVAYDAWVARFRNTNARVHLVSRIETDSKDQLLGPLKDGYANLPTHMLLPISRDTATILELDGGPGDTRTIVAYAARAPGRGYGCDHLHLDEWAAMAETSPELPKKVWAAAEPAVKPGGTIHILTTGVGPVGFYADVWRACEKGKGSLYACFVGVLGMRPDYTEEFLEIKRRDIPDEAKFAHEYPMKWQDALAGEGDTFFTSESIELAHEYAAGFQDGPTLYKDGRGRERKRKYIKAWDIAGDGEEADAVVGIVLDITEHVWDVVAMEYHHSEPYPVTALRVKALHAHWPGPTYIEDNSAGKAVRQFCELPEDQCIGHYTTRQLKPECLMNVKTALQAQELKWNPEDCPELDAEMKVYKLDDAAIEQDTVMALSIAVHHAPEAMAADGDGRILSIVRV